MLTTSLKVLILMIFMVGTNYAMVGPITVVGSGVTQ